jgi:hypothetical protein
MLNPLLNLKSNKKEGERKKDESKTTNNKPTHTFVYDVPLYLYALF